MKYIDANHLKAEIKERIALQKDLLKRAEDSARIEGSIDALLGLLNSMDTISEEPDKSLEEAAEEYATTHLRNNEFPTADSSFKAGADWQKEQFEKNRLTNCDKLTKEEYDRETDFALGIIEGEYRQPTFTDAINYGMLVMKDQMMKEAVEVVVEDWNPESHPEITIPLNPEEFTAGDKVKLIVIKED